MKILIANRGEIAIRIARAAAELAIPTVAVYSQDDARSLHITRADEAIALPGTGARAYLDGKAVIEAARSSGADAIHPGYGFLSENGAFAAECKAAGITFIGPEPSHLELFGDKGAARRHAAKQGVPVVPGVSEAVNEEQALAFFAKLPEGSRMIFKALAGGGGRGMRVVNSADEIPDLFARASSEALASFGNGAVYVEQFVAEARHIEVQVAADGAGNVMHFGTRDCTVQRRHQKIIEIAPAPFLPDAVRDAMQAASVKLARAAGYRSLGTFEFLYEPARRNWYFIEANARLQVEHTVTEAVMNMDLVQLQIGIAQGRTLADHGFSQAAQTQPRGIAIQARVNMETMQADGSTRPTGGVLTAFDAPSGPGIRTDSFGYTGYQTNPNFDSLLAKVIVHVRSNNFAVALKATERALADFRIEGIATNIPFLRSLLNHGRMQDLSVHTRFIDEAVVDLLASAPVTARFFTDTTALPDAAVEAPATASAGASSPARAGAKVDAVDPLAVLDYGKAAGAAPVRAGTPVQRKPVMGPAGSTPLLAPMQGTIVSIDVKPGDDIRPNQVVIIMEAMKMEHEVRATTGGSVREVTVSKGDTVFADHPLVFVDAKADLAEAIVEVKEVDLSIVRTDVAEVILRHDITLDAARPDAVEKRRRTNQRTARENIDQLCDPGTFVEHGQLVLTPGTGLPIEEVIRKFPTDGMVTGVGTINGREFGEEKGRSVVMAYDYTVLAGTQGAINHPKTDRMLELAEKWEIPMVLFAEGGGGRAGTGGKREGGKSTTGAGQGRDESAYRPLDTPTFASMGRLSGLVPMVGITSRFCFAGNASLLGCCDVIIATRDSNIGMGGPALIEGGGLGVFRPEEIGPIDVQIKSGVVDVAVEDEVEAVDVAKKYLGYFQGRTSTWSCVDQRHLRNIVPENRLRVYDIREVIRTLADEGSVLELREGFGLGIVTSLIRIEGRPVGLLANNPGYLSGAIDSEGSDKAARFMQLCDAFDIPMLVLCDTPGMMVGPDVETTGLVRHCSRLFVTGANLTVPLFTIVIRKAYGLGAQAMAGGSFKEPYFTVAWPTAEFGGMGLEGQVKLGFRNELAGIADPVARKARYDQLVDAAYQRGKAIPYGVSFGVDDVIDPADSRRWISRSLDATLPLRPRHGKKRRNIDTW